MYDLTGYICCSCPLKSCKTFSTRKKTICLKKLKQDEFNTLLPIEATEDPWEL